jgi:Ni/Fe-hydrogenase subunit HybB-like protein
LEGFVYPNEYEVAWGLLIVLYPYITGLVAGAFVVSSLYHVLGLQILKPVARLSLLTSLAFLLVAPLSLMAHLGQPLRALEIFWTPNLRSAMAGFGYIWLFYLMIVLLETWMVFRPDIVGRAQASQGGPLGLLYRLFALGGYDLSPRALEVDHKAIKFLAAVGVPVAFILHGYVGFIFGAIKANPWWSTPLMPIIFLMSAIVSGIALLIVIYAITSRLRRVAMDRACLGQLSALLLGFLVLDLAMTGLELLSMAYEQEESWHIISRLLRERLAFSYLGVQLVLGALLPAALLIIVATLGVGQRLNTMSRVGVSGLVLVGVFAMRWNVVIGGQLFSKSLRGFKEFSVSFWGQEGIAMAGAVMLLPVIILVVLIYLLPPWLEAEPAPQPGVIAEPSPRLWESPSPLR